MSVNLVLENVSIFIYKKSIQVELNINKIKNNPKSLDFLFLI